jgi:hypothetical protein
MKSDRLIFMNLAIDQIWDRSQNLSSLFPMRIPESEYLVRLNENLGFYLSQQNDAVIGFRRTPGFLEFLQGFSNSWGEFLEFQSHPYDQDLWLKEAKAQLKQRSFQSFLPTSLSTLEEALLRQAEPAQFSTPPRISAQRCSDWNQKTFLIALAGECEISLPQTRILNQTELLQGNFSQLTDSLIVKHQFGSGGGGNFAFSYLPVLRRRLSPTENIQWLLQEKIKASLEGSIFGETENPQKFYLAKVDYNEHGLSYRHDFQVDERLKQKVFSGYQKVCKRMFREGYKGPIGMDFIVSEKDQEIYFIDLNLRWTKTHLIRAALDKFNLRPASTVSLRHRWKNQNSLTFERWWTDFRSELRLNDLGDNSQGQFAIPYTVAGIEGPGILKEVSLFLNRNLEWESQVIQTLQKIGALT